MNGYTSFSIGVSCDCCILRKCCLSRRLSYSSPVVVFLLSLSLLLLYLMLSPVLLELFYISLSLFLLSSSVLCRWLLITTLYFWFPCRTLEAAQCSQFTDAGFQALCRVSTLPLKACLQLNMALCVPLFFSLYTVFHGHMRKIIKVFTQAPKRALMCSFLPRLVVEHLKFLMTVTRLCERSY